MKYIGLSEHHKMELIEFHDKNLKSGYCTEAVYEDAEMAIMNTSHDCIVKIELKAWETKSGEVETLCLGHVSEFFEEEEEEDTSKDRPLWLELYNGRAIEIPEEVFLPKTKKSRI